MNCWLRFWYKKGQFRAKNASTIHDLEGGGPPEDHWQPPKNQWRCDPSRLLPWPKCCWTCNTSRGRGWKKQMPRGEPEKALKPRKWGSRWSHGHQHNSIFCLAIVIEFFLKGRDRLGLGENAHVWVCPIVPASPEKISPHFPTIKLMPPL